VRVGEKGEVASLPTCRRYFLWTTASFFFFFFFFFLSLHFVFHSTEKYKGNYAAEGGIPQQLHEE
jgi:lipopolysaccharide export LptBFGC system permease protein LptF